MNKTANIINDVLILTGAGFSKPAGCKLSNEMLKDLENKSNDENEVTFTTTEKKTIKFILSCLDYQARWRSLEYNGKYFYMPNIEEFAVLLRRIKNRDNYLPYPITGNWSDKIMLLEQEYKNESQKYEGDLYSSIESKIIDKSYKEWLKPENLNFDYISPLKTLLQNKLSNTDLKLEIFTLNNDLVMEQAFKEENTLYTGFVSNKWVGFDKSDIDENTYTASRINYYKLHGSLDWYRLTDGSVRKKTENEDIENIEIDPLLIFGHGTKVYTIEPFFSILESFKSKLKEKKYYIVIGYSFFDPHVNNLIFNELMNDDEKILLIVNPKISDKLQDNDFDSKNGLRILKESNKKIFLEEIENIQKNPLFSDLPEFNLTKISTKSFEHIAIKTEDFLKALEEGEIESLLVEIKKQKDIYKNIF